MSIKKPKTVCNDLKGKKRTTKEQLAFQEGATWALLTLGTIAVATATYTLTRKPETETEEDLPLESWTSNYH